MLRRAATLLCLFCLSAQLCAQETSLAFKAGKMEAVLDGRQSYCLVLGSLASYRHHAQIRLHREPVRLPVHLPEERVARRPLIGAPVSREQPRIVAKYQPHQPPKTKSFHLFVGEGDLENSRHYVEVRADLLGQGQRVQVYVDQQDKDRQHLAATCAELIRTFENEILPWSEKNLGPVEDIDRDGRFTVLLSSWLGKLQAGKTALDGFVRGSDFLLDLPAPFSNHCDMLYLNADLEAGPYLRSLVAHEFSHAIGFCAHVLHGRPNSRQDEESWLSEGLAHLVEQLHGHSWRNLDYRLAAFLAEPERYPLVVPDYYMSGLWRTPGTRGCVALFLRWSQMREGPDFPGRMLCSPSVGLKNLESATGRTFAETFRSWTVALARDEAWRVDRQLPGALRASSETPSRLLGPPRVDRLHRGDTLLTLPGTACQYLWIPSLEGGNQSLEIETGIDESVQATLIPWPGCLELTGRRAGNDMVLSLEAFGAPQQIVAYSLEPILPVGQKPSPVRVMRDSEARRTLGTSILGVNLQHHARMELPAGPHRITVMTITSAGKLLSGYTTVE